jgi:hypothetical protein
MKCVWVGGSLIIVELVFICERDYAWEFLQMVSKQC